MIVTQEIFKARIESAEKFSAEGKTIDEIAVLLSVSTRTARRYIEKAKSGGYKSTADKVKELYLEGWDMKDIVELLDLTKAMIWSYRRMLLATGEIKSWPLQRRNRYASKDERAALNLLIKLELSTGKNQNEIARLLGCERDVIKYAIKAMKKSGDIPDVYKDTLTRREIAKITGFWIGDISLVVEAGLVTCYILRGKGASGITYRIPTSEIPNIPIAVELVKEDRRNTLDHDWLRKNVPVPDGNWSMIPEAEKKYQLPKSFIHRLTYEGIIVAKDDSVNCYHGKPRKLVSENQVEFVAKAYNNFTSMGRMK
ncbi:MAG: hypothetical protein NTW79_04480 [Candidatus Berkelbacteria bacterium]|nr:hypothetical protein [Candidatus Berkelbacteria bacterium]